MGTVNSSQHVCYKILLVTGTNQFRVRKLLSVRMYFDHETFVLPFFVSYNKKERILDKITCAIKAIFFNFKLA